MPRRLVLLAACLFAPILVFAQSGPEADVGRAVKALETAILAADKAKLESLCAPELSYGHSGGRIEDRTAFVDTLATGKTKFSKLDTTKQTISVTGDHAIVRNHMSADFESGGKPGHVEIEILYVWHKRGGEWKLLARQAYKI